ncbi:hypothetical protein NFI96_004776 [Prochilodus magdalenae]|nr:hypothetical protein NFI96_004776 [Prochilodus magdalenae]
MLACPVRDSVVRGPIFHWSSSWNAGAGSSPFSESGAWSEEERDLPSERGSSRAGAELGSQLLKSLTLTLWMLPFVSALYITVWVVLVFVVRCQKPCCRRRGLGYLLCAVLLSITVAMNGIMSIYYLQDSIKISDISGHSVSLALLHILTASALLDHPGKIQQLPHTILHLFGSSGLSIITSITLVTELILKSGSAGTGLRTLPELHIIILPFESLFISGWITLQTYNSWLKMRHRIKSHFKDERKADSQVGHVEGVGGVVSLNGLFCDGNECGVGGVVSLSGLFCVQVGEGGEEMEVLSSNPKGPEVISLLGSGY